MHTYIVYHHVNLDGGVKGTYVSMTQSLQGKGPRGQRPISIMPLLSSFFFNCSCNASARNYSSKQGSNAEVGGLQEARYGGRHGSPYWWLRHCATPVAPGSRQYTVFPPASLSLCHHGYISCPPLIFMRIGLQSMTRTLPYTAKYNSSLIVTGLYKYSTQYLTLFANEHSTIFSTKVDRII
jgi:hypothetical protein